MATLTNRGNFGTDRPHLQCDECEMIFSITWNPHPVFDTPEFCPFCGEDADEIVWTETQDD